MKKKVLIFVGGVLAGAIIASSGFIIYGNINKDKMQDVERMQMMERPDGETPPEKPSGTENDSNRPEPPSKNNSSSNNKTN